MENDLKPCPFCGGEAQMVSRDDGTFFIGCTQKASPSYDCFCPRISNKAGYERSTIAAWNTRSASDQPDNKIAAGLRDAIAGNGTSTRYVIHNGDVGQVADQPDKETVKEIITEHLLSASYDDSYYPEPLLEELRPYLRSTKRESGDVIDEVNKLWSFTVDGTLYKTNTGTVTGAEIKSFINRQLDFQHVLIIENQITSFTEIVRDDDIVGLFMDRPQKLFFIPPAHTLGIYFPPLGGEATDSTYFGRLGVKYIPSTDIEGGK